MKTKLSFGYITVPPSDYVIHTRRGKIINQGMGITIFCLPLWDQYCIIPSTANNISFTADQITKENQGVEINGFAIWKVCEPQKTYLHFDFSREEHPVEKINAYLKDVVESAIRHQVANMTIEDVLRKRVSIILQLKEELAYITGQWGLVIDTIEIKNVQIMSKQLFANMQAKYRDAVRLESETSSLRTEKEIAEQRLLHEEQFKLQEQESKRRELERKSELNRLTLEEQKAMKLQEMANQLALSEVTERNRQKSAALGLQTLEAERSLETARMTLATQKKEKDVELGRLDLDLVKERIAANNTENPQHMLYQKLPEIAAALQINELNIGQDQLAQFIGVVMKAMKPANQGDQTHE